MSKVYIFDTTLRDGSQGENITFSAMEKLRVARELDKLGVDYIEGGWPGSNPKDIEFFALAQKETFKHAKLTAFGSTCHKEAKASEDYNIRMLLEANTPAVAVFGKSWDLHVKEIMGNTLNENLRMIEDSVAYLKSQGKEVIFDAEHFFDGYHANPEYAMDVLSAAQKAGADFLVLCDTNGGTLPFELDAATRAVKEFFSNVGLAPKIGVHTHNDCGVGVACAIAGVRAGACMVHGTMNGYGERCGNADLTSIIPILSIKMAGYETIPAGNLKFLLPAARVVNEIANVVPLNNRPFVGKSAFAHKGGIHVSAVNKNPRAYEHMNPELVGNVRRVLTSDQAGKSNIIYKAHEMGINMSTQDSQNLVRYIKELEQNGYQFDAADGSLKILMEKIKGTFKTAFELEAFRVSVEKDLHSACKAYAMVKISVNGKTEMTAAEGQGPVGALDNAIRKALYRFFPEIDEMQLVDFKVRVIEGSEGTGARVRVVIETRDKKEIWNTVGVSEDIIEASWQALADSFYYKLKEKDAKPDLDCE